MIRRASYGDTDYRVTKVQVQADAAARSLPLEQLEQNLLPAFVVEVVGFVFSSQRVPKQLLNQMGPLAFTCLRERVQGEEITLHESIKRQFSEQSNDLFEKANGLINEALERQNKILEEKRDAGNINDKENERQKAVLRALGDRFSQVYKILYGYAPESGELEKYAKKRGKIVK